MKGMLSGCDVTVWGGRNCAGKVGLPKPRVAIGGNVLSREVRVEFA